MPPSSESGISKNAALKAKTRSLTRLRTARLDGDLGSVFEKEVQTCAGYAKAVGAEWDGGWAVEIAEAIDLEGPDLERLIEIYEATPARKKLDAREASQAANARKQEVAELSARSVKAAIGRGWDGLTEWIEGRSGFALDEIVIIGAATWQLHGRQSMNGRVGYVEFPATAEGTTLRAVNARMLAEFGYPMRDTSKEAWAEIWAALGRFAKQVPAPSRAAIWLGEVLARNAEDDSMQAWEAAGWWEMDEETKAVWPTSVVGEASKSRARLTTVEVVQELRRQGWTAFSAARTPEKAGEAYYRKDAAHEADTSRDE